MPYVVHVQIIKEQSNHSKKKLYLDKKTPICIFIFQNIMFLKVQNLISLLEARVREPRCLLRFLYLRGSWSWTAAQVVRLFCHELQREQFSFSHALSHMIYRHAVFLWDPQSRRCF